MDKEISSLNSTHYQDIPENTQGQFLRSEIDIEEMELVRKLKFNLRKI